MRNPNSVKKGMDLQKAFRGSVPEPKAYGYGVYTPK